MNGVIRRLREISVAPPREGGRFDRWLEQKDMFDFLSDNISDHEFVLYASLPSTFIYGIAVPIKSLKPLDVDDLLAWGANPSSSWNISTSFGEPPAIDILAPLHDVGSNTLAGGEQIIYARRFDGREDQKSYFELAQRLAHLLDLHYVPERRAYCMFDRRGDVEDIFRIVDIPRDAGSAGGIAVTVVREKLDEYLALTDAVLVRLFDITRFEPKKFGGWRSRRDEDRCEQDDFYYRKSVEAGYAKRLYFGVHGLIPAPVCEVGAIAAL